MSECECDLDNECALHRRIARLESERDALKSLLHIQNDDISKIKAELELEKGLCKIFQDDFMMAIEDRDLWKSRAAKCELSAARYREALEKIAKPALGGKQQQQWAQEALKEAEA